MELLLLIYLVLSGTFAAAGLRMSRTARTLHVPRDRLRTAIVLGLLPTAVISSLAIKAVGESVVLVLAVFTLGTACLVPGLIAAGLIRVLMVRPWLPGLSARRFALVVVGGLPLAMIAPWGATWASLQLEARTTVPPLPGVRAERITVTFQSGSLVNEADTRATLTFPASHDSAAVLDHYRHIFADRGLRELDPPVVATIYAELLRRAPTTVFCSARRRIKLRLGRPTELGRVPYQIEVTRDQGCPPPWGFAVVVGVVRTPDGEPLPDVPVSVRCREAIFDVGSGDRSDSTGRFAVTVAGPLAGERHADAFDTACVAEVGGKPVRDELPPVHVALRDADVRQTVVELHATPTPGSP